MRRFLAIPLMLTCLAVLQARPQPATNASQPTTARATTAQKAANLTDAQIEASIRTKLAKSKIGKDGFRFHVQHGVVTWEGTTNVIQHKGSATRMARTAGAIQVINNIQISSSAKAASNLKKAYVQPQEN